MTNTHSREALKPCPFCGGDAKDMTYGSCDCCGKRVNGSVGCNNCQAKVDHLDSAEEAATAWNTRADLSSSETNMGESVDAQMRRAAGSMPASPASTQKQLSEDVGWRISYLFNLLESSDERHTRVAILNELRAHLSPRDDTGKADSRCKCSFAIRMTGDGCRYCQPQTYIERLEDIIKENQEDATALLKKALGALEGVTAYASVEDYGAATETLALLRERVGEV